MTHSHLGIRLYENFIKPLNLKTFSSKRWWTIEQALEFYSQRALLMKLGQISFLLERQEEDCCWLLLDRSICQIEYRSHDKSSTIFALVVECYGFHVKGNDDGLIDASCGERERERANTATVSSSHLDVGDPETWIAVAGGARRGRVTVPGWRLALSIARLCVLSRYDERRRENPRRGETQDVRAPDYFISKADAGSSDTNRIIFGIRGQTIKDQRLKLYI